MAPLAPLKLNILPADVAAASGVRRVLKDFNLERDAKGDSPMHPSREAVLKRLRVRLGQENALGFWCPHDGCDAPLADLSAAYRHCFTCAPLPPFSARTHPESSSDLANVFLTTHRDVAGDRLPLTLAVRVEAEPRAARRRAAAGRERHRGQPSPTRILAGGRRGGGR
jgi:hypothetical protein